MDGMTSLTPTISVPRYEMHEVQLLSSTRVTGYLDGGQSQVVGSRNICQC